MKTAEGIKYSANWDDSGWWFVYEHINDKTKVFICIEADQDDGKANLIADALNAKYASQLKTVEPEKRAELLKEIMDTDQEHGMYETEKEEHECTNVETFKGWGNQKCFRCKDCGKTW